MKEGADVAQNTAAFKGDIGTPVRPLFTALRNNNPDSGPSEESKGHTVLQSRLVKARPEARH